MPSLSPGTAGAKEAFGISVIRDDYTLRIPPKPIAHYRIDNPDIVLLTTGHVGGSGFGLIKKETAKRSVFWKRAEQLKTVNELRWFEKRAYVMLDINDGVIRLNDEILNAFYLKIGDRLVSVKSTTVTMSLTPDGVWEKNFEKHGFTEAIKNLKKLKEF